jgi:hypothetical protein
MRAWHFSTLNGGISWRHFEKQYHAIPLDDLLFSPNAFGMYRGQLTFCGHDKIIGATNKYMALDGSKSRAHSPCIVR